MPDAELTDLRCQRQPLAHIGAQAFDIHPGPLGGDRRSGQVGAQSTLILVLLDQQRDARIEELRNALSAQGRRFG